MVVSLLFCSELSITYFAVIECLCFALQSLFVPDKYVVSLEFLVLFLSSFDDDMLQDLYFGRVGFFISIDLQIVGIIWIFIRYHWVWVVCIFDFLRVFPGFFDFAKYFVVWDLKFRFLNRKAGNIVTSPFLHDLSYFSAHLSLLWSFKFDFKLRNLLFY